MGWFASGDVDLTVYVRDALGDSTVPLRHGPLSYAAAEPVASLIGIRQKLVAAGVLGALVTFGFLFLLGMRRPQGRPRRTGPADTAPTARSRRTAG